VLTKDKSPGEASKAIADEKMARRRHATHYRSPRPANRRLVDKALNNLVAAVPHSASTAITNQV
jgi:hypothetical protein